MASAAKRQKIQSTKQIDLGTRACLVRLKMSRWDEFTTDQVITDEVSSKHLVDPSMGRWRKRLIPSRLTRAVSTAINDLRRYNETHTLPWGDDRYRVLPGAGFMQYSADMATLQQKLKIELDKLVPVYRDWLTEQEALKTSGAVAGASAAAVLGDTFDRNDYPDPDELVSQYSVEIRPRPLPTVGDFRIDLGNQQTETIRAMVENDLNETVAAAMKDIWLRFQDVLTKATERLKACGKPKPSGKKTTKGKEKTETFRDSLLENISDLLAIVPALNITEDPAITEFAGRIKTEVVAYSPAQLREDVALRNTVVASVDDILSKMGAFL